MLETLHFDNDLAPLSQYVANEQSCLLDDHMMTYNNSESSQTESELEDDEAAALGLLRKVKLNMQLYREYLEWTQQNSVQVEKVRTGFIELP